MKNKSRMVVKIHLPLGFAAGRGSCLVMTAGPELCAFAEQRAQPFDDTVGFAGRKITEVRNARSSSSVTPRTSWPL